MVTIYHNPRCSKSREALSILEAEVGAVNIKEYLKTGLEESEVRELISLLENDISELIRTNEKLFKDAPFDPGVTEEVVEGLIKNPKILQRPIIIIKEKAIVGRPIERLKELL